MSRTEVDIIDRDELFNRAWLRLTGCVKLLAASGLRL